MNEEKSRLIEISSEVGRPDSRLRGSRGVVVIFYNYGCHKAMAGG